MNDTPRPAQAGAPDTVEDRFRYIGFEVFPKQVKEFWKNDSEQKSYLDRVKETAGRFVPLSRTNSFVATTVLSTFERIVLAAASAMLVIAPFIPWFSVTRGDHTFSYSGIAALGNFGNVQSYLAMGDGSLNASFMLMVAMMILSMLFGLATLAILFLGGKSPEASVGRLHRILMLQYIPLVGWVTFFVMVGIPTELPFAGSLGLSQVESTLNLGSLAASSSLGLWIPFAALWVNAIKSNDL